jgi:hypothetical protein
MNHYLWAKTKKYGLNLALCFFSHSFVYAWDCHFLITYSALENRLSEQPSVVVETLEDFLTKEREGLTQVFAKQEEWSRQHIKHYPSLPTYLRWNTKNTSTPLTLQFVEAIRVNPLMTFPLFVQYPPGVKSPAPDHPMHLEQLVVPELLHSTSVHIPNPPLMQLFPKDLLSPLEILATASDEPDYGMDINLWEDNPSWFGKIYGWGEQPFGSKTLSFSSQVPFHMGLYHDSSIIYAFAPYLERTYPEFRIHQYLNLSRYAFATGHAYWGYRFLGWALHYAQDLTQPYHSTVSPNVSIAKLLYVDALKLMGITSPEQNLIQLLTNRHNSLENYEYYYLKNKLENKKETAISDSTTDKNYPEYTDMYPRKVIAKESNLLAASIDKIMSEVFPVRYVWDANYIFYQTETSVNLFDLVKESTNLEAFNKQLNTLLGHAGAHTRKIVGYAQTTFKTPP